MPSPSIPSNLPAEPLRWTLLRAEREIGLISAPTLATRLRESGEHPDAGDCWSTAQVLTAAFGGDLHTQRVREVSQRADALSLKNAILRGEVLDRGDLESVMGQVALGIRRIIESSPLPKEDRNDILRTIAQIPIVISDRAARQSRNGNGSGQGSGQNGQKRKRGRPRKAAAS
ncbi:MAG TPA: hypothetical protein VHY59_13460 [Chthoniobacterales bacterium]|nr:hypothetical protein [Chthoniobacterales bacterium]